MVQSINLSIGSRALLFAAAAVLAGAPRASAQVNTEAMRGRDPAPGLHASLAGRFTWVAGNSEFAKVNSLARVDYLDRRYHGFLVGNYEFGRQGGETFIHNGFAHFRNVYRFAARAAGELFAQLEFNDFLMLQQRRLLGAGIRCGLGAAPGDTAFGAKADLGLGLMQEHEEIEGEAPDGTTVMRATSYASLAVGLGDRVTAQAVAYYQPRLSEPADYRILGQAGIAIGLYGGLSFETALKGRFDSRPPDSVRPYDFEAVNGLKLAF